MHVTRNDSDRFPKAFVKIDKQLNLKFDFFESVVKSHCNGLLKLRHVRKRSIEKANDRQTDR
jgi:hypothetical protein